MNPIEHLWGAIKRILKGQKFTSKKDLIEKVLFIWNNFPQESINGLVESFENRLKWVIHEKGKSITNILRNGIHNSPESFELDEKIQFLTNQEIIENIDTTINDEPIQFLAKRPFTIEENIYLLQLVKDFGKNPVKWCSLSHLFVNRTALSLRTQYFKLMVPVRKK